MQQTLIEFSKQLSELVAGAGRSVVAVHARERFSSSGVVWQDGVVVTAEHTVRREDDIRVTLPDGTTSEAKLAGRDSGTDIAVLRANTGEAPPLSVADGQPGVGGVVMAVGRGRETGVNATLGALSARGGAWRTWRGGSLDALLRLDIRLHPGLSGSAVIGPSGEAFGIASSSLTRVTPVAIPASTIRRVVAELLERGRVARGYLGLGLQPVPLPDHLTRQWGLEQRGALMVLSVELTAPAGQAGVLLGDILVALNGRPVTDTDEIQEALGGDAIGRSTPAVLIRGGQRVELSIKVGERPGKA